MDRDREFTEFVVGATPRLRRLATLLTGDLDRGDDLLQDALLKTYLRWPRIQPGSALAYTRRVMATTNTDRWRKERREPTPTLTGELPEDAFCDHHDIEDRDLIVRELGRLTPRERTMVVLRYYADLPEQAVADELGVSVGTVKSTCSRALASMRAHHSLEGGQS